MEHLAIPFNQLDKVVLVGGRSRRTAKQVYDSLTVKPDYLVNAGMYDTKTGLTVCDTVIDHVIVNGGNYTSKGFSWNNNDFAPSNTTTNKTYFLGGAPTLLWADTPYMDMKGLSGAYATAITKRIGLGITKDALVVCFPSKSCNLSTLQAKMQALGCTYAINLDGGGSTSVMDANCKAINTRSEDRANSTWLAIYLKHDDNPLVRVYSLKKDGERYIRKNFKAKEFACKDGTDVFFVSDKLFDIAQKIRDHFNAGVTINSGYRTVAYNSKVSGSSEESQHCLGLAADIVVRGVAPSKVADYAEEIIGSTGGVGRYSTFTHIDVRGTKARWKG